MTKSVDLKRFRIDKNITQIELSDILNINQGFLSQIENNKRTLPESKLRILNKKYGNMSEYISSVEEPSLPYGREEDNVFKYLREKDDKIEKLIEENVRLSIKIEELSKFEEKKKTNS